MQNIVNHLNLFLYNGKSIVNSCVYFVKNETTALTFSLLSGLDRADFISVYDNAPPATQFRRNMELRRREAAVR